jgi:hypothetical protein
VVVGGLYPLTDTTHDELEGQQSAAGTTARGAAVSRRYHCLWGNSQPPVPPLVRQQSAAGITACGQQTAAGTTVCGAAVSRRDHRSRGSSQLHEQPNEGSATREAVFVENNSHSESCSGKVYSFV